MSACPRGVDVPASSFLLWEMAGDIPKLLGTPLNFWGHPKASEDASKLLGPGAHGNHSTLPEPTSGEQGCAPTVGDQPVGPGVGGHCFHWGQDFVWIPGEGWASGQMRQRGCREDRGCLVALQAGRGTPRAAHTPQEITPAGRGQRAPPGEGVRMLPCAKAVLVPCPGQVTRAAGGCWGHPR